MRNIYKSVYVLVAVCALSGCYETKVDDPKLPNVDSILAEFKACNRPESELQISQEASANKIVVHDKIEIQDIEDIKCDGSVSLSHGPVRMLHKDVFIEAPANLSEPVEYVSVENFRSCSITKGDAIASSLTEANMVNLDTVADTKGRVQLTLTDDDLKLVYWMNVRDGQNLLKISYFGKCKTPKVNPDMKEKFASCEEENLLGTKEVLLVADIERPEVPGVLQKKPTTCPKKEDPSNP